MSKASKRTNSNSSSYSKSLLGCSSGGVGGSSSGGVSISKTINDASMQDGYNCITKDGLDNIFLTYFFKLPSCSPSDRTQVRIENSSILKLKIIQETKFKDRIKKKKSPFNPHQHLRHKQQQQHHRHRQNSKKDLNTSSTASLSIHTFSNEDDYNEEDEENNEKSSTMESFENNHGNCGCPLLE